VRLVHLSEFSESLKQADFPGITESD
jgi:hypothetical protein